MRQSSIIRKKSWHGRDSTASADSTDRRFRSPNITPGEKDLILSLVKERLRIVECKKTDIASQHMKTIEWQRICEEFNARSGLFHRTPATLRAAWDNWKKVARKCFLLDKKTGEISKKDPFIEQVGSVMVAAQDLFKNNRNSPESAKDLPLQEISQEGIIEIVKTDISLPEDEFQNSSECHSDDFSIDSNPTDIMVTEDSAIELVPEGRQTFSNIMNLSGCSSTQHVPCSSTEEIHQPLTNMELTETTTGSVHDVTAKSPDTSTHRPQCYILVSSSLDTTQQNVNKISKTLSSVKPIELDRSKSESSDLTRAKLEAVKVMTKNSIEEHSMLKEMFAIKMLQEKEKLELERRKYDVENERLAQEKIKSQILLLQLEQLRRTVN